MSSGGGLTTPPSLDRLIATFAALVVIGLAVYLLIRNQPINDARLFFVLRVILCFAAATLGATIPGFLDIQWSASGLAIRTGGALALFVLTYIYTPGAKSSDGLKRFGEEVDQALRIKPDDPWNVVVGKARSLRDLGRLEDAARAYASYAEMFAGTDPTADRFSRTAQLFTRSLDHLGVKGGVYVYAVRDGGGRRAGLLEGDVIVACGDRPVMDAAEFQHACQMEHTEAGLLLTWLRLLSDGTFARATATVLGSSIGVGVMPI